jgi:hypothetical protein
MTEKPSAAAIQRPGHSMAKKALGNGRRKLGQQWEGGGRAVAVGGSPSFLLLLLTGQWREERLWPAVGISPWDFGAIDGRNNGPRRLRVH